MNKKTAITFLVVLIVLSSLITGIFHHYSKSGVIEDITLNHQKDTEPPTITLKFSKLILYKDTEINYDAFVLEVTDNVDKDLIKKLEHNKIDTSQVGEQTIVYKVKDSSGNEAKENLTIIIRENLVQTGEE